MVLLLIPRSVKCSLHFQALKQNSANSLKLTNMPYSPPFYTTMYKACPSESGTEVGTPLFPAVELCDFSGRWQCMS